MARKPHWHASKLARSTHDTWFSKLVVGKFSDESLIKSDGNQYLPPGSWSTYCLSKIIRKAGNITSSACFVMKSKSLLTSTNNLTIFGLHETQTLHLTQLNWTLQKLLKYLYTKLTNLTRTAGFKSKIVGFNWMILKLLQLRISTTPRKCASARKTSLIIPSWTALMRLFSLEASWWKF